jgi:hypothetical protein
MNRTLEQVLRAFVSPMHDDWDRLLRCAELAYNSTVNASTGYSPYELDLGQNPSMPANLVASDRDIIGDNANNVAVESMLNDMRRALVRARDNLIKAQERQKKYADEHRRDESFVVGDRIMLDLTDLTFPKGAKKLHHKWAGPFSVVKVVSTVSYQIDLPANWRIHDVFHVSKLKRFVDTDKFPSRDQHALSRPAPVAQIDGEDAYEVEAVLDKRKVRGKVQYFVKWVGYPSCDNMWLPVDQMGEAQDAIDAYEQSRQ